MLFQNKKLAIGIMSGTSMDGIDVALVDMGAECVKAELVAFETYPYAPEVRSRLLELAKGDNAGVKELCLMQELLGKLYAKACLDLCKKAKVKPSNIDFVGCHGQTLWHQPEVIEYLGENVRGSLQLGDPSFINEAFSCPVVSDFRLRDMAAGGQGAPIVPYTEFLLYRGNEAVALLNIGGIANITILPAGCRLEDVLAFDVGPGNVLIDKMISFYTQAKFPYDRGGKIALSGTCNEALLRFIIGRDEYLEKRPPKSTGREHYNWDYLKEIYAFCNDNNIDEVDAIATVTRFTAECVKQGIEDFAPCMPGKLIVSGGGSHNEAIMGHLKALLPECQVMTATEAGINPDAKEAVAMAILAGEALKGQCNNVPSVTGAEHPVVMGRVSY
ncbi:anhydro-N-acetylmuramic acid kinase [Butyrivibrio proteoclasticus]|uniref:anhydro-N-acetylmuramic acid kinase n=1 Tax=Butyrivibrio proteoclasticus TaxID=43305 RepID=UPI00047AD2E5|nr:anhydro-N-acetylmuramic acid kinase [Butyrivibrio proteoclasticus]